MFRKMTGMIMMFLAAMIMFSVTGWTEQTGLPNGLRVATEAQAYGKYAVGEGDCYVDKALEMGGTFYMPTIVHETWVNPLAVDSNTIRSVAIATATLQGVTTTWTEAMQRCTQWDVPRTLAFRVYCKDVVGTDMVATSATITSTLKLIGYDTQGSSATETITSTCCCNSFTGNIAWAKVTDYEITYAPSATTATGVDVAYGTMYFVIGTGAKLGLSRQLEASTDVIAVNEGGTGIYTSNTSLTVSATYDTVDFVTDPTSSASYQVWYWNRRNR